MSMEGTMLTSRQWCERLRIPFNAILDPDGWDRKNYNYSFNKEPITKEEFVNRLSVSTVRFVSSIRRLFGGE